MWTLPVPKELSGERVIQEGREDNLVLLLSRLDSCELTLAGYEMIATLLLSTTSLKCLSLAKNEVGVKSMISLGNALSSSTCPLQKLMWVSLPLAPWLCCIWDGWDWRVFLQNEDGSSYGLMGMPWCWDITRNPIHSIMAALLLKGSLMGVSQRPLS